MAKDILKKEEDKKKDGVDVPFYTKREIEYISNRRKEMATSRNIRESTHDEFDGMTYAQRCESNRKGANTFIAPKKNKEDTTFVTGTTRQKIFVILSALSNLNITSEVHAFDDKNLEDVVMSHSLDLINEKTSILDNDDEKKILRQYTMLEQGEVFVEEIWDEKFHLIKDETVKFDGKNIKLAKWKERLKKISSGPTRNILLNENVYLGSITQFDFSKQPFIFTVEHMNYEDARAIYVDWERWQYVDKGVKAWNFPADESTYNKNWTITEVSKDNVEIVKYQNKNKNEYTIFINGILMTPVGLPIPRKWGQGVEYNIIQQIGEIISPYFAYGKSMVMKMRTKQAVYDEMLRLAILKTQKSFMPPMANNTGVHLSTRIMMPGKMTTGIDADRLKVIGDANGVQRSEVLMMQEIQKSLDDDSTSPIMQGKNPIGTTRMTATQSQQLRQQADLAMTGIILAATFLETKIGTMRLYNNLENWFKPIGQTVVNGQIKNKYRSMNIDKLIEGEGSGQEVVRGTQEPKDPMQIYNEEEKVKSETGVPTRIKEINPDVLENVKYTFYVTATQKPRKNSDLTKVLFNEMMQTASTFPNINMEYMSERFADIWGEDPTKMFKKGQPAPGVDGEGSSVGGGNGARGSVVPKSMTQAGKPRKPSINTMESLPA